MDVVDANAAATAAALQEARDAALARAAEAEREAAAAQADRDAADARLRAALDSVRNVGRVVQVA
jgi:hypothetical protein